MQSYVECPRKTQKKHKNMGHLKTKPRYLSAKRFFKENQQQNEMEKLEITR